MNRLLQLTTVPFLLLPVAGAQWSTPTVVASVNSPRTDSDPVLTIDGLTLYFSSATSSTPFDFEIYRATRATPYGGFGASTHLSEFTAQYIDAGPCPRIDDLEFFFTSNRTYPAGGIDIYRATRTSTSVPFGAPVPVAELNTTAGAEAAPSLTLDGLRIYFYSTRPGSIGGGYDLWTATRPDWSSPFGTPVPIHELNTPASELDPHISPDGLAIFFSSDRAGSAGAFDLWVARRLDPTMPFGAPVNLTELNTMLSDGSPGFGLHTDEFFFSSLRPGGPGGWDIHSSRFTGLVGVGYASASSHVDLRFSDPASPASIYLAASAFGSSPGIPIDTRVLPLNLDPLLQITIGGLPPVLTGYVGALSQDGIAAGRISFAGFPQFVGLRFSTAFVVLDLAAPSGIRRISNAFEVQVQ